MNPWISEEPPPMPGQKVERVVPVADVEERQKNLYAADLIDLTPWGSDKTVSLSRLATEIVLYSDDLERFAQAYGLTTKQYKKLRLDCKRLDDEVESVRSGMKDGDRMTARFRDIIHSNLGVLVEIINDPAASNRDRLNAFEIAGRFAGIKPREKDSGVPSQANQIIIHGAPPGFEVGKDDKIVTLSQSDLNEKRKSLEREARRLDNLALQDEEIQQAEQAEIEAELPDVADPEWGDRVHSGDNGDEHE